MATSTRRERPVRTLVSLAVLIIAIFGALVAGNTWSDANLTPKLALDLEGGTQIVLRPVAQDGAKVTDETIKQAIDIIRQRVDASGVAEAEITSQGGTNIVVALPGEPDEATLDLVRESAQMLFRPVIAITAPQPFEATDPGDTEATPATPTDPSDPAWITPELEAELAAYDCTDPKNLTGGSGLVGDHDAAVVACDETGTVKYVLGPVEVPGSEVASATSALQVTQTGAVTNKWVVNIEFNAAGTTAFRDVTQRLLNLPSPRNQFAMVLDGLVISAPSVNSVIPNGQAEISGTFNRDSAALLARQLNFGALPLTFEVQSEQELSATLGSEQLERGLLAGLIGLVVVGIYSLVQYRVLGLVTITSLVLAAVITYGVIALLSWTQGYRLSLPGVAGLIVAIGITADSFIVYFERIRDELRDGRTLPAAVEEGWRRARRTIFASDAVSFLAAVVLYFLAVGGVRGFAFTLGLTTIIDVLIVVMFTHPLMVLFARTKFFGLGHSWSGLAPEQLGTPPRYLGRGRVSTPDVRAVGKRGTRAGPVAEAVDEGPARQTIAERRAAAANAAPGDQDRPVDGEVAAGSVRNEGEGS